LPDAEVRIGDVGQFHGWRMQPNRRNCKELRPLDRGPARALLRPGLPLPPGSEYVHPMECHIIEAHLP
jgi:hypothetical protein